MYNDTLKVANKIISATDLIEIFDKMNDDLEKYKRQYKQEEMRNQVLDYSYQEWSLRYFNGTLRFDVNFYDDTRITFDNYYNFISIYNNRLDEIKSVHVSYNLSYTTSYPGMQNENYYQRIHIDIYESKMDIDCSISSNDNKMDEVYNLIKTKILNAPEKYDHIIKKKNTITNKISLAIGIIPSIIIATLLLLIPTVREVYSSGYVVYPIACILLGFVIGTCFASSKLDSLYKTLIPEKKYAGYDANKGKSIYKDDIDKYVSTSEILIGKNANNMKKRQEIIEMEKKYSKFIPIELIIILLMSIIVLFL